VARNQLFLAVPAEVYERIDWSDGKKVEDEVKCRYCRGTGKTPYYIIGFNSYVARSQKCSACHGTGKIKN